MVSCLSSFENRYFLMRFRAIVCPKTAENADGNDSISTLFRHLSFLPIHTRKAERFQKAPLLKPFSKVSVFISVFGCFSVDDRQKQEVRVFIPKRSGPKGNATCM